MSEPVKITEEQQNVIMGLQRKMMELDQKCKRLRAEHAVDDGSKGKLEATISYLKKQPEDSQVYTSIGRMFFKEPIKESITVLESEVKELGKEIADSKKVLSSLEKELKDTQAALIEYLNSNKIPYTLKNR